MFHLSKKYSTVPDKEEYAIIKILLFGRIWARTVRILVENYVTIQANAPRLFGATCPRPPHLSAQSIH